jgi:hypothetical protein
MSRARPEAGCVAVSFREAHPMDEPSEVALEDYARVLTRARAAEAVPSAGVPGMIEGVHLCGASQPPSPAAIADIEGFARSLLAGRAGGLGWS